MVSVTLKDSVGCTINNDNMDEKTLNKLTEGDWEIIEIDREKVSDEEIARIINEMAGTNKN